MANRSNFYKLEMLILSILKKEDCYGYQITKSIKERSKGVISVGDGTMYNILYKMMDEGFVSSYDKIVGRKVRVYYHLEEGGRKYLDELIKEFHQIVRMVQSIIDDH